MTTTYETAPAEKCPPLRLEELLANAWSQLESGAKHAREPFHLGVLGSYDGSECSMRTVVLRGVNRERRELTCHTDYRSPKVGQVERHPRVAWLFYDPTRKVQLRLKGWAAVLREGPVVEERWEKTSLSARRCYLAQSPPGTPAASSTSGLDPVFERQPPSREESIPGRVQFAVIVTTVDEVDWLWLNAHGHRRARFAWSENKLVAEWAVP